MVQIPDQAAREAALNINESYIVQAPAGSGKTSLLTQRYLALLAKVQNPEEIVAITFTKKAAGEMQERIIEALLQAKEPPPKEPYLLKTYELAKLALAQNQEKQWHIFENKYRLRILTIDAFCLLLTNRMPLLSKAIPYSFVADDPEELYRCAAEQTLKTAANHQNYLSALKLIQTHLGNNHSQLIDILILMLQKREQWLPHVISASKLDHAYFEQVLKRIQQELCEEFHQKLSTEFKLNVNTMLNYQAGYHPEPILTENKDIYWDDFSLIKKLSLLLLSSTNQPKKRFTKNEGFPSSSGFKTVEEKNAAKEIKIILEKISSTLSENEILLSNLVQIKLLPLYAYTSEQWLILEALLILLPLLAAELSIVFSQTTKVDFSEISMQALNALGDETPTELALYLDYEINHLLIDEFQDTSKKQYLLLERLTESWFEGDGKSLFLVGDPMQSIYRFREADVGLFLSIQKNGINQIQITPLQLTCNFRSSAGLVKEVNQLCQTIFPSNEDIDQGAVTYASSTSLSMNNDKAFYGIKCRDKKHEALLIKEYILKHPNETIAILVRSRSQLKHVVNVLKEAQISIEGINLESLSNRYIINLLTSITKLTLNPTDFTALSDILVSPLCGISYQSLAQLLSNRQQQDLREVLTLSEQLDQDSRTRVKKILYLFIYNQNKSYRKSISEHVYEIWQQLNGPALMAEVDHSDIAKFWQLLDQHDKWPFDMSIFERQLANRFSEQPNACNVKVMTIHRSKGLEFDTVIMPSVDYASIDTSTPLLHWLEFPQTGELLLSPIHSVFDEKDPLSSFIQSQDKQKEFYERQRLFYVAITRAKTKLLMFDPSKEDKNPNKNSFLSFVQNQIEFKQNDNTALPTDAHLQKKYYRLKRHFFEKQYPLFDLEISNELPMDHEQSHHQIIGEYIHLCLYFIAENQMMIEHLTFNNLAFQAHLFNLGLKSSMNDFAQEVIKNTLVNIKQCPIAKWILTPRNNARNELQINTQDKHYIIDRTFIEEEVRWIIDYKISEDPTEHQEQYVAQLNLYASLFAQIEPNRKIKLLLYYPLIKQKISWYFTETGATVIE